MLSKFRTPMLLLLVVSPFCSVSAQHADPGTLVFGFLPSRSPVALFRQFTPLREYLSHQLKRPVHMESTPDYANFLRNTQNRKYDFVLTAPHFALLAIDSGKYTAPVTYTRGLVADILVHKDSPLTGIDQLAGSKIALPPASAIITLAGRHYLSQRGLNGSDSPRYITKNSHNASIHALLAGETAAAVASMNISRQFINRGMPVRRLAGSGALPGMAFLVASDLPAAARDTFVRALIHMRDIPEGKAALAKMSYPGYRKARPAEFEAARPYLEMHKANHSANGN